MIKHSWQKFLIMNRNGLRLAALLCEAKSPERNVARRRGPVVAVCHGFTGSKEGSGRALEMGEALAEHGFSCLLFDFAGCGESEGLWEDINLSSHIGDLADVARWCRGAGFSPVILNGRSFGGAAVLCYAATDVKISGVCTWAAPARLTELFRTFAGGPVEGPEEEFVELAGEEGVARLRKGFFYDLKKHDLLASAAKIAPRPLLVIHGTADEVVCPTDARLLADAAGEPKQLALVDGADHRFSTHTGEVWPVFFEWLNISTSNVEG